MQTITEKAKNDYEYYIQNKIYRIQEKYLNFPYAFHNYIQLPFYDFSFNFPKALRFDKLVSF